MLRDDPIVAAYPLFLLGLPLTLKWRGYPLLLVVPLWRNRGKQPVRVVVDHLWFGVGVLRELGAFRPGRRRVKVLVLPRDENPYQGLLYGAMDPREVEVRYLDGPTSSQTLNVLALPLLLLWHRARGFRLLHIHWVHPFLLAWARSARARGVVQRYFELFLPLADALGYRIVWTAHNLLPHEPVFRDDVAARRVLVKRSDAVIAHSRHTAGAARGLGAGPCRGRAPGDRSSRGRRTRPRRRRLAGASASTRRVPSSCSSARCSRTRASTCSSRPSERYRRESRSTWSSSVSAGDAELRRDLLEACNPCWGAGPNPASRSCPIPSSPSTSRPRTSRCSRSGR